MFKSVATLDFYEFQCRCWLSTLLQPLARKIPDWPTLRATAPEAAADMSEQNIDHPDKFWPLEPGHNRRCCQRRPMHQLKAVQCHFNLATHKCVYGQSCFWWVDYMLSEQDLNLYNSTADRIPTYDLRNADHSVSRHAWIKIERRLLWSNLFLLTWVRISESAQWLKLQHPTNEDHLDWSVGKEKGSFVCLVTFPEQHLKQRCGFHFDLKLQRKIFQQLKDKWGAFIASK